MPKLVRHVSHTRNRGNLGRVMLQTHRATSYAWIPHVLNPIASSRCRLSCFRHCPSISSGETEGEWNCAAVQVAKLRIPTRIILMVILFLALLCGYLGNWSKQDVLLITSKFGTCFHCLGLHHSLRKKKQNSPSKLSRPLTSIIWTSSPQWMGTAF